MLTRSCKGICNHWEACHAVLLNLFIQAQLKLHGPSSLYAALCHVSHDVSFCFWLVSPPAVLPARFCPCSPCSGFLHTHGSCQAAALIPSAPRRPRARLSRRRQQRWAWQRRGERQRRGSGWPGGAGVPAAVAGVLHGPVLAAMQRHGQAAVLGAWQCCAVAACGAAFQVRGKAPRVLMLRLWGVPCVLLNFSWAARILSRSACFSPLSPLPPNVSSSLLFQLHSLLSLHPCAPLLAGTSNYQLIDLRLGLPLVLQAHSGRATGSCYSPRTTVCLPCSCSTTRRSCAAGSRGASSRCWQKQAGGQRLEIDGPAAGAIAIGG